LSTEFKLSRDPRLLEQYYELRQQCFRKELGIPDFDGSEDEQDREGQILVAIQDGRVIGGARISPNVPAQKQLQELDLKLNSCCMWERFVIDPAVRTIQLFRDFCAHLIEFSWLSGFQHALILSSLRNARFYRQYHTTLGIGFKIHRNVPNFAQGAFAGLEHYLSVSNLQDCVAAGMPVNMSARAPVTLAA
jgi:N-acyl-L-homoserine lactone synthetase